MPKKKPTVISLSSGAGGMDHGFLSAGFDVAVCVESDRWCCETLKLAKIPNITEARIEDISSSQILAEASLQIGEADVVIGAPPVSLSQNPLFGKQARACVSTFHVLPYSPSTCAS